MSALGHSFAVAAALCFATADSAMKAGEGLRAGKTREQQLAAAVDERERAAIEDLHRDRPEWLNDYVVGKLDACLRASAVGVEPARAAGCYDQTLWASALFASKRRGVTLERMRAGYPKSLAGMIDAVYAADQSEGEFRRDWFVDCLIRE